LSYDQIRPSPRADWHAQWRGHAARAMLFDLDGTLLDTAPDLAHAANHLRLARGLPALPIETLRPFVSQGARGMLAQGLGISADDPAYDDYKREFLEVYGKNLSRQTGFWPGMKEVVDVLDARGMPWGVVTNKIMRFTEPLLKDLDLFHRCAVVVGGDTTAYAKPHPAPLAHALERLQLPAQAVAYVGDDLRDIQSGFAAGTWTIACDFGHHAGELPPERWGADQLILRAETLIELL